MQQLILLGTFFVLPVYLQVVLGLDAFETGKRLFPMSVAMFIAALLGPRLAAGARRSARRRSDSARSSLRSFLLLGTIDVELKTPAVRASASRCSASVPGSSSPSSGT